MIPVPPIVIDIDLSGFDAIREVSDADMERALQRGMLLAVEYVKALWHQEAVTAGLRTSGRYVQSIGSSIEVVEAPNVSGGSFSMAVDIHNDDPRADIIENGSRAFHLPSAINWSSTTGKIKRSPTGRPYLHVPFRHAAFADEEKRVEDGLLPSTLRRMMPQSVYNQAKRLARRVPNREGPITRPAVSPAGHPYQQHVASDRYSWSGAGRKRLERGHVNTGFTARHGELVEERRSERQVGRDRHGPLVNPEWQTSKYEGLMKTGPKRHTQYLTIRTMTPDSPGWNIPARAGHGIVRRVSSILAHNQHVSELMQIGISEVLGAL